MNAKGDRARIRLLRTLILCSILLLLLFLGYWLRSRYRNEKEVLQKDLAAKLDASKQEVTDSMVMVKVLIPALSKDTFRVLQNASRPSVPHTNLQFEMTTDDSIKLPFPGKGGSLKTSGFVRKVSITSDIHHNDTGDKMILRSLGNVLKSTGVFDDTQHFFLLSDTGMVKRIFLKRLQKSKYAFSASYHKKKDTANIRYGIMLPVFRENTMVITGYRSYLINRITPDILFALLLIGFTSGAFWLSLRSLRQQMRLSIVRNDLVSNMSHELKTPVATVKVALEALDDEAVLEDKSTVKDYVNIATLELNRLELLINQTLHTSLLEEGKLHVQLRVVDMSRLTEQVLRTMDVRVRQQHATLSFAKNGQDFKAHADSLHLQGVIFNVIDNALKYGGDGVAVSVMITELTSSINISISDNGPGIPTPYLRHVFDKFFRVPTDNLHNIKGYGLGLSYATQVMKQHSGSITVTNNETAGCTFTITLPKVLFNEA